MDFFDLDELNDLINESDFEERPVSIETFVQSEDYLNFGVLSENQYHMIKAATQIYRKDTLIDLYGEEEGLKRWKQTYDEVIYQLGKGSGKDLSSTIACAYVVYLLLCLKNPAKYYGKPDGDNIDILNIAINATQANNVFFKNFVIRIEKSPWFEGKWTKKGGEISFDKNITVYSGHSEREGWEGYNLIFVVLDEISGFALDSNTGNQQANTASATYKMYRASVNSRFPKLGKLALLSFPRFKGDFITQRYNQVVAQKDVIKRTHTFKLNDDLPDGAAGNEFTIEWDEDHIISYTRPGVYALKRPTWEVNPLRSIEDFKIDFFDDVTDALGRYACMPPEAIDAFFKDRQKVESAFISINGVDEDGRFRDDFQPDPDTLYFVHVDLAKKHDHCAVGLAHVSGWRQRRLGNSTEGEILPVVKVDAIRWWTPTTDKNVDFDEVQDYIVSLQQRGFNLKLVTFDRWRSDDMILFLNKIGIKSEVLSVAKRHYSDFAMVLHGDRLEGPDIKLLRDELLELRIMPNDKVDHPRKGSKDLADAVCGAIYNAVALTPKDLIKEIEISTYDSVTEIERNVIEQPSENVISPPRKAPPDIEEYLTNLELI